MLINNADEYYGDLLFLVERAQYALIESYRNSTRGK